MSFDDTRPESAHVSSPHEETFPLLPLRNAVLFPGHVVSLPLGRKRSLDLARSVQPGDLIGVAVQRDPGVENPAPSDLHPIGTRARVARVFERNRRQHILLEGLERFRLTGLAVSEPFWMATGEPVEQDDHVADEQTRLFAEALRKQLLDLATDQGGQLGELLTDELVAQPGLMADAIAAVIGLPHDKALRVLFTLDVLERLRLVTELLVEVRTRNELKGRIDREVRESIGKNQREALLREQLRAIQRELGDDDEEDELDELETRLDGHAMPEDVRKAVDREMRRLRQLNPNQPDYNVLRNWLDLVASLPWGERAQASLELDRVAERLEADHYGLDDVKKRILEHMAVLRIVDRSAPSAASETTRKRPTSASVLCLAGPPGVGKTSLGQSIAAATDRPFVRIALGGVRDEAELRGHRRTYIGALPGRIIGAMKKAGVKNPVILLDEIDKVVHGGWSGDPQAALLEILDPEQNHTFTDHYLEQPFDLSEVLFICTANDLGQLSAPLRDRLEIIPIAGYTPDEKLHIARTHLVPDQREAHSLSEDQLVVDDQALGRVVREYTREAGVRQLKREIQKICRAVALEVVRKGGTDTRDVELHIGADDVPEYLGKPKFFEDVAERTAVAGVATGLAWTPVGGDILFIETTRMPGKGRMEITGQLGEVMQESARAALAYVRTNANRLGIDPNFLDKYDIHVHVPAGAVPKDGPSAGVTIFTALTSLLSGRKVRHDTAMTGEVSLRGRVLPVGGIKAKVLAAHRAGIEQVILPARNRRDLEDVPQEVRDAMTFVFAEDMSQVLTAALEHPDAETLVHTAPVELDGAEYDPATSPALTRGAAE